MAKQKILIQFDVDDHPSVFDSVVAVDSSVDHLFRHNSITCENVEPLVHGAIFTRGIADLKSTAIFVGGSDVSAADQVAKAVKQTFFGPMKVSVMCDANGSNTTAAAAVLVASKHVEFSGATATVLAGTGPVGQRISRLLAGKGVKVNVGSRYIERATDVCNAIRDRIENAQVTPFVSGASDAKLVNSSQMLFAAGAAGYELMSQEVRTASKEIKVAIDLNAVPPVGLAGIDVMDKATEKEGQVCYGAIGVGGTKMKIHKAAIAKLFESNDLFLDAEEIYAIGESL